MTDFLMWAGGIIISGLYALTGWLIAMIFGKIKDVETEHKLIVKSLSEHKIHAAETFATKQDVDRGFDRVISKLDGIEDKLDKKADK